MDNGLDDEVLLLDLLNSTPVVDGRPTDQLDRQWLTARGLPADDLPALAAARDALQAVVRGDGSPDALAPHLAGVVSRPRIAGDGVTWQLDAPAGRTTAVRAVLAWDALRTSSPGRLRPCANDECRRFLLDRSKPNTARWCSMATCGNRMKARRHHQRLREG